jgi:predicted HTH transcriptional regulator
MNENSFDISKLAEDYDLEVKKATGRDGRGELPKDFWPTYSAMANTEGGIVLLGVEEKPPRHFRVLGITDIEKVRKALWDGLNNRQTVSANILNPANEKVLSLPEGQILRIDIPRASRKNKPIFVGGNPIAGTYRRNYEGDYLCDEETVRRMIAEQVEETRDAKFLDGFSFDDLDIDAFKIYRTNFKSKHPDHPWNDLDNREFLRQLGGWTKDRQTGDEGMTVAGLLMFGKLRAILDVIPNYIVDYQERPRAVTEQRWTDRLTTDGTWSGNLYDFYRLVIQRLYRDLKVPFQLQGAERQDDTPVHEALREALVNALIHADYSGRISILVVKRPDLFGFRNPGGLRISLLDAMRGGMSDCRNRNLQKMFQMIGLGEQAGSGFPKIYRNWNLQHWRRPELFEQLNPDQTILTMRMVSLLPEETLKELDTRFGQEFRRSSEVQRLALAAVAIEGSVTHRRLTEITMEHSHDLSKALHTLTDKKWLESDGSGPGTFYYFAGSHPLKQAQMFEESSEHLGKSSEHLRKSSEHLTPETMENLKKKTEIIRNTKKAPKKLVEAMILDVCRDEFVSLNELAEILNRDSDFLRNHYINRLADNGRLERAHPNLRNHPKQRYRTRREGKS